MRAGKAYIASAGTTGVLLAGAILLLVVVGALMAFKGDAEPDAAPRVEHVLVAPVERAVVATPAGASDGDSGRSEGDSAGGGAAGAPTGDPRAPRERRDAGDGPGAAPAPVILNLDEPPGEGSGDAEAPAPAAEPPAGASEPLQASNPVSEVGDVMSDVIRGVTAPLPRAHEAEAAGPPLVP